MINHSRDQIIDQLLAVLKQAPNQGSFIGFKGASRTYRLWDQITPDNKPFICLKEYADTYRPDGSGPVGLPSMVITLNIMAFIYVWSEPWKDDLSNSPIKLLNPILDSIDAVLRPSPLIMRQNLGSDSAGDFCYHCYIDGEVRKDAGELDGDGIAMVPIKVIVPA
jgi:hypothetical protein